eukprot:9496311-Pyramimonas_sp.AAC.1
MCKQLQSEIKKLDKTKRYPYSHGKELKAHPQLMGQGRWDYACTADDPPVQPNAGQVEMIEAVFQGMCCRKSSNQVGDKRADHQTQPGPLA